MSWTSEDGAHKGSVVPEFADGARGTGASNGQVPDGHIVVAIGLGATQDERKVIRNVARPVGEAIGWRVICDCRLEGSVSAVDTWTSELLVRVPSKALEDPGAGRLFVWRDEDVAEVEQVHPSLYQLWRRSHVDHLIALQRVRQSHLALAEAREELDRAARDAHRVGHSWEAIGRVVGMSRQSAHERWRHP